MPEYNYPASPTKVYRLSKMGQEILVGTEQECWSYLHRQTPYSVTHALRWGGYRIWPYDRNQQQEIGIPFDA